MHQSIHNGSIARADSTNPKSAVSQPKRALRSLTSFFAVSLLPQMNIVGELSNEGFIIFELPVLLNAFTKLASGTISCNCSIKDLLISVKNCNTCLLYTSPSPRDGLLS